MIMTATILIIPYILTCYQINRHNKVASNGDFVAYET